MRYKVIERRCYDAEYIVEADSPEAASKLAGTANIISEDDSDTWAQELLSVEEVDEDAEL